ncbi:hypothetical protein PUATCC27989T_02194 [Phytobacter ursingii]|uniref:Uncharacterized protein n=2 Tax=Enterobacteriaceae TaxID=543 RepID=A0AAC8QPA4_9ENTR|nr:MULTISPECIES: hypothetical protein [Enterobacteriaceae]MDU6682833.1 hypothetical protein [Enterobacteriaceae bacterium]HAT2204040.1 hypothetical protein [Kluyvera intermedia]AKL12445.1 hypothetical protein AB182_14530 [Phytobacter ursingii]MDV2863875.1 hypothetical protein [Phytobacter ursingii]VTP14334.1 hypothetical protein PUATCC27989T_02194 [Phytobacter ursingii]
MSAEREYYADDEGTAVDLLLPAFGSQSVQCINLDAHSPDDKMRADIQFLIEKQNAFSQKITAQTQAYCKRVYGAEATELILVKIYLSPDEKGRFGFMFTTDRDHEHGIGLKFMGLELKSVGSSETAFL